MNTTTADHYIARFRQVLQFINTHLDEDLPVERLAAIAGFSKYHYRQFSELFGIGVYRYVQMLPLKRAAHSCLIAKNDIDRFAYCSNRYFMPK